LILLSLFQVVSPEASPEALREKALRFQYEQQLKDMRAELARLQTRFADQKKELQFCVATNSELRVTISDLESRAQVEERTKLSEYAIEMPEVDNDEDLYKSAMSAIQNKAYNEATLLLESLVKEFPKSPLADNALFMMGELYMHRQEYRLAELEFIRLLQHYPKSERREDAVAQIRELDKKYLTPETETP